MSNIFRSVLWPHEDGDSRRWIQWLMTAQVRRIHRHCKASGQVWQRHLKAIPIPDDGHFLTVVRYVERNPLRATLVAQSQDSEWSSLKPTERNGPV